MKTIQKLGIVSVWLVLALVAPAQQGETGLVTGMVYDSANGSVVPQVVVEVVGLPETAVVTTTDGAYRLALPPGTYRIRLSRGNYLSSEIEDVVVTAGGITDASSVLASASSVTSVDVVATADIVRATAETMIAERKLSPVVSDTISGIEIKQSTASDAAGALQPVTGVSVIEGGHVFVRGLGERYSATQLNNALLATTEPERRIVPLDLFPASLIDNIQVKKTYTPDLPGEFSAGLVKIQTAEFPTTPIFEVSFKVGFNDQTTRKRFLTYPGGSDDFWGFDDGSRALPEIIPTDQRVDRFTFSPAELQEYGRAISKNWETAPVDSARPSMDFGLVAGGTFGKLGLIGAFQFSNSLQTIPDQSLNFYTAKTDGTPVPLSTFVSDQSTMGARMGALFNASYQLTPAHKFQFKNFLSRDTDNDTRTLEGYYNDYSTDIVTTRMRWVERHIYSTQLGGNHLFTWLANSMVDWQIAYSDATRDESDLHENVYSWNSQTEQYEFHDDSQSAYRMFNFQEEHIWNPQINWLLPFYKRGLTGSVKVGIDYSTRNRDFNSRRFRLALRGTQGLDLSLPPNELLIGENINPRGFELTETTRITDAYEGIRDVWAGYAMVDLSLSQAWRVIGGVRMEDVDQNVTSFDQFHPDLGRQSSPYVKRSYLPGINVVYSLTPLQNLRFGYSQTVSRPDFRELALFDFLDIGTGGRLTVGNPDLRQTEIRNLDLRWEWFPGGNQLIAASFFYKDFKDPIERVVIATVGELLTYDNAAGAENYGLELEFRRSLEFLSPRLQPFSVSANFTFVDSNVDLSNTTNNVLTSRDRAMQGQSRYITNFIGEWSKPRWRSTARFYVNYFSGRITDVGSQGLPDVIEGGRITMDFVYEYTFTENGRWKIRFQADNLNNPEHLWTVGDAVYERWNLGRSFKIGTSFRIL